MGAQPSCPLGKRQQQQLRGEQWSGSGHAATVWEATLACAPGANMGFIILTVSGPARGGLVLEDFRSVFFQDGVSV